MCIFILPARRKAEPLAKIQKLLRRNIIILSSSIILLLSERVLEIFSFPTDWTNIILQGLCFIVSLLLLIWLKMSLKVKFLVLGAVLLLNYSSGFIPTFKWSASSYLSEKSDLFSETIHSLEPIHNHRFSINSQLQTENLENCDTSLVDYEVVKELIQKSAVIEIYNNKDATLFAFHRFIDNGYGLIHIRNNKIKNLITNSRYKIIGLELRNLVELNNGWHYVSFT